MSATSEPQGQAERRQVTPWAWCCRCDGEIIWVECPTGGWWAHLLHPDDNHDAEVPT